MNKLLPRFFLLIIILSAFVKDARASDAAKIYTAYIPPVVLKDPKRPGLAYEIVAELFKSIDRDFEIIHLPWARAQHMAKNTPEALIFPFSKTATREAFYEWKVNIFNNQTHFITFNGSKLNAATAKDKQIGVQLKSSWDNWLTEQGYKNVYRVPKAGGEFIKLLRNKRLDAWYTDLMIAGSILKGLPDEGITYSDPIQIFRTYLATSKSHPYPHMDELAVAMEKLRSSGKLDELFTKYDVPITQ